MNNLGLVHLGYWVTVEAALKSLRTYAPQKLVDDRLHPSFTMQKHHDTLEAANRIAFET